MPYRDAQFPRGERTRWALSWDGPRPVRTFLERIGKSNLTGRDKVTRKGGWQCATVQAESSPVLFLNSLFAYLGNFHQAFESHGGVIYRGTDCGEDGVTGFFGIPRLQ